MPLIGTLTSGVSAVRTFSKGLEVIGANIANVNTTAYKSSSISYSDTFSNTLRAASATDSGVQIGTGVQVSGISTNYTGGPLVSTGRSEDLGIAGSGFFVVQDPAGNSYATRDGSFHFDKDGYLLNGQNYSVLDSTGAKIQVQGTDAGGATVAYSALKSVSIASDGTITAYANDGTADPAAEKIGILAVSDQSKLMKQGNNLYDFASTGATLAANLTTAGNDGTGTIQTSVLEQSNVDLTQQFSDLITTQRSFQAGSRLITVSDSVLEDIVNLKRS